MRLVLAILLSLAAANTTAAGGTVEYKSILSPTLGRPFPAIVYLPDDYQSGKRSYPVLYLLHGAGGDERAWLTHAFMQAKADKFMGLGMYPPAIIVMPGCVACWWVDGAKDKAETAFWMDFVPAIDAQYRTIKSRKGRIIAGVSAGGYGAIRFGLRYPDKVAAVAALSPAVYTDLVPKDSSARVQPPFLDAKGNFDEAEWTSLNYPIYLEKYFAQAYRVQFYLISGDVDKFGIAYETALLFKRLFERQPEAVKLRVVGGDHEWSVWEAAVGEALQFIFQYADRPQDELQVARVPSQPEPTK